MPVRKAAVTPGQVVDLAHMVRILGPETMTAGNIQITSYLDAENHLREAYFSQGWDLEEIKLLDTATGPEMGGLRYNTITMLYVLVKRAV